MLKDVFLAGGVRTPIGALNGSLAEVPAPRLGAIVVGATLERSRVPPAAVDEVIFGNVIGAGLGQNVARQCAIGGGLAPSVGATSVNRVCGSGLKAVMLAAQAIQLGDADVIVAGGTESMSGAPYLLEKARRGYRLGHGELVDAMIRDGLWDVYNDRHMGSCGELAARKYRLPREEQDDFAVRSYRRALEAQAAGTTAAELVPVEAPARKGSKPGPGPTVERDDEPRRFDEEKLRRLAPAFEAEGTITAGNASSINDGAAAVTLLSGEKVAELGIRPQARILGYATFSQAPEWFTTAPVGANARLLEQLGADAGAIDIFEVNEAFAVVPLILARELSIPLEKVNPLGGAIALGHPIGASGARTLVTLLNALSASGGQRGIVSLCVGGGEAVALAVERL